MSLAGSIEAGFDRAVGSARRRSGLVDHVWRAGARFTRVLGGRLAAGISYYAFFAAFSLGVLAYSIVGRLLGPTTQGGAVSALSDYLQTNLPWVAPTAQDVGRGEVTVLASLALLVSGVGWVEALRSSLRAVWGVDQHPGHWLLRRLVDLGVLAGLGVLLGLSLATTGAIDHLVSWLAPGTGAGGVISAVVGPLLEFSVNLALAAAMLTGVSRMHLSPRRLLPSALAVALAIQLLNTVGRFVIARTEQRPAYAVVAGAAGLLLYLYVLNQVILFGAALAATSRVGTAVDLGRGVAGIGRGVAVDGQERRLGPAVGWREGPGSSRTRPRRAAPVPTRRAAMMSARAFAGPRGRRRRVIRQPERKVRRWEPS